MPSHPDRGSAGEAMRAEHRGLPRLIAASLTPLLDELVAALAEPLAGHEDRAAELMRLCAVSPFIARCCTSQPALVAELATSGDLDRPYAPGEYLQGLRAALFPELDEAEAKRVLRLARTREMLRIAWRDICRDEVSLDETLAELSAFAEAVLETTLGWCQARLRPRYGRARGAGGAEMGLAVLGMGKLGAGELNFSSDIDLVFVYEAPGETAGGRRSVSHEELFDRLGRLLIEMLSATTAEGQVHRVDMRLRPFGDSGPLTSSRPALIAYLEAHGRDWERYAWIKARTVAGDRRTGDAVLREIRPFIYRRYLDFGALESLREMKRLIAEEASRRGMAGDIKRGRGGIREIEFTGQALQIIRGGREPALRERAILTVLERAGELGLLPADAVAELQQAYVFLRRLENRLQQLDDRQTHALPADDLNRARVALALGYHDWKALTEKLAAHRERVGRHFDALLGDGAPAERRAALAGIWELGAETDRIERRLREAGITGASALAEAVARLHDATHLRRLGRNGFARMAKLLPAVLDEVAKLEEPVIAFERIAGLLDAVATRSVYLALLAEHPAALQQLVRLCSASPWITDQLVRQPVLLDELLDPRSLYAPPARAALEAQLEAELEKHPAGDLELAMNALREFKHAQALRVAAADIAGELPVAEVSNHLSDIAEVCVQGAYLLARQHLVERHGTPRCLDGGRHRTPGFAIIAYGKLGGLELGYGSDLDLVFVHDSRGEAQHTDGARSIDNSVFFTRLGQRLIHLLQTRTAAERVYEVDARLRPSGDSGLLVVSLEGFRDYQLDKAWTWEHQALVRARAVAGETPAGEGFERIRREVLARRRAPQALARDIAAMRARMRRELGSPNPALFDIKQDAGGITDIEFVVQYMVLRWASDHPCLLAVTDNLRLLETLARTGLLPEADCRALHDAYFAYRAIVHRQALQEREAVVATGELEQHRAGVQQVWQRLFGRYEEAGERR